VKIVTRSGFLVDRNPTFRYIKNQYSGVINILRRKGNHCGGPIVVQMNSFLVGNFHSSFPLVRKSPLHLVSAFDPSKPQRRLTATSGLLWYFMLLALALVRNTCVGQPDWVKTAIADTSPSLANESASYITLFETRDVRIDGDGHAKTLVRTVQKIIQSNSPYVGCVREYKAPDRDIRGLNGWKITSDGKVNKLEDKDVVEVSRTGLDGVYDEGHTLVASFPQLNSGDVVAFEYFIIDGGWAATYQSYLFQEQQPVRHSEFSVEVPSGWKVTGAGWNIDSVHYLRSENRYTWTALNLPYRAEEPLMPPWDYLDRVINVIACNPSGNSNSRFSDWNSVSRWTKMICDTPTTPNDSLRAKTLALVGTDSTIVGKIQTLANYVRDEIRYVGIEIGREQWLPHEAQSVLTNRYGDCKDKVTLLRSMLKIIGVPSSIVLVNPKAYVSRDLPTPFQFNHAIIAIPAAVFDSLGGIRAAIRGQWMFFDPTSEANPFGALPVSLQGSLGLVATENDSNLTELPVADPTSNLRIYRVSTLVESSSSIVSHIKIVDKGPFRHEFEYYFKVTPADKKIEDIKKSLSSMYGDFSISDYVVGSDQDSVWSSFTIRLKNGFHTSGSMIFVKPGMFVESGFPLLTRKDRLLPIWFGGPQQVNQEFSVEIPADWVLTNSPFSKESHCLNVASLTFSLTTQGNTVHFSSHFQQTGALVSVSQYNAAKAFSRDLKSCTDFTIAIKQER